MKKKLQELIQKQVLILDGAMGTEIQKSQGPGTLQQGPQRAAARTEAPKGPAAHNVPHAFRSARTASSATAPPSG